MVDRDLVLRKIADMERYLADLSEFRGIRIEAYAADWKVQRIVERTLHLVVEAAMDIADHLVADRRLPVPETAAGGRGPARRRARARAWTDGRVPQHPGPRLRAP